MKKTILFYAFILLTVSISGKIKIVDFLKSINLQTNATGPLMVRYDDNNKRIILLNTNSSYVSIINTEGTRVKNIFVNKRTPQYLKDEIIKIATNGDIYFITDKSVIFIDNKTNKASIIDTKKQYESLDIDEKKHRAFLVSRESKYIFTADFNKMKSRKIELFKTEEEFKNLNQTPPPPVRKIITDPSLKILIAINSENNEIFKFSIRKKKLKFISKKRLNIASGKRWHLAGINRTTHKFYTVIETKKREVLQAFEYNIKNDDLIKIDLPVFRETAGVQYNPQKNQVYIPYDNNGLVTIADFNEKKSYQIEIPGFGNDAIAFDNKRDLLFVSSWQYGEIEIIDLKTKKFIDKIENLGILPHTFSLAYSEEKSTFYIPRGATAVNGSFGASILTYNLKNKKRKKIYTGWSPVSIVKRVGHNSFFVFNSEDEYAEVSLNGEYKIRKLPYDYPHDAVLNKNGNVYLSYGPHQSYWPTVYIWPAKNGILTLFSETLKFHDRRIPRLANRIITDKENNLYCLQNAWGKEKMFLSVFNNELRYYESGKNITLKQEIERETTPVDLKYDDNKLYILKSGESETENGRFIIYAIGDKKELLNIETEITPTSISYNDKKIFITNFDSDSLTIINKEDYSKTTQKTGKKPLKSAIYKNKIYVINHIGKSIFSIGRKYKIPVDAFPDNIKTINNKLYITLHNEKYFYLLSFNPKTKKFHTEIEYSYNYGQTRFETGNTAFFMRGQFADAILEINKFLYFRNKIIVSDYLSGKLFIVDEKSQ